MNCADALVDQIEGEFERVVGEIAELRVQQDVLLLRKKPS